MQHLMNTLDFLSDNQQSLKEDIDTTMLELTPTIRSIGGTISILSQLDGFDICQSQIEERVGEMYWTLPITSRVRLAKEFYPDIDETKYLNFIVHFEQESVRYLDIRSGNSKRVLLSIDYRKSKPVYSIDKGYGFIKYENREDAVANIISYLNGKQKETELCSEEESIKWFLKLFKADEDYGFEILHEEHDYAQLLEYASHQIQCTAITEVYKYVVAEYNEKIRKGIKVAPLDKTAFWEYLNVTTGRNPISKTVFRVYDNRHSDSISIKIYKINGKYKNAYIETDYEQEEINYYSIFTYLGDFLKMSKGYKGISGLIPSNERMNEINTCVSIYESLLECFNISYVKSNIFENEEKIISEIMKTKDENLSYFKVLSMSKDIALKLGISEYDETNLLIELERYLRGADYYAVSILANDCEALFYRAGFILVTENDEIRFGRKDIVSVFKNYVKRGK